MAEVISDREWNEFTDDNFVSEDVIEIVAIRIMYNYEQTPRELAIYKEHSTRVESKIKNLKIKKI